MSNVFLFLDGVLVTPDPSADCREGVTREIVLELASELGMPTRVADVSIDDLRRADEIFFTGTGVGCLPVRAVRDVVELRSVTRTSILGQALEARVRAQRVSVL
jgi:branched-subunit amino acid aminotransferase/4-amino-4-deoxychorismate lyase